MLFDYVRLLVLGTFMLPTPSEGEHGLLSGIKLWSGY